MLVCVQGELPRVDGHVVRYQDWKLFDGPFVNAERGSRRMTLTHGGTRRVIDFNTMTVTDSA